MRLLAAVLATIAVPHGPSLETGDVAHAWVGGAGGVYATRDGGQTWALRSLAPVSGLAAVGSRYAWFSSQGILWRTTDGGVHWAQVSAPHLLSFSFLDPRHGFGLDRDGIVLRTADGGRRWQVVRTPRTSVQAVCFPGLRRGWVARGGSVWSTWDGGGSWTRSRLLGERQGYPIPELRCRGDSVWVLFHEGVAAGSEGYVAYRSLSDGASWRPVLAQLVRSDLPRIDAYSGPFAVPDRFGAVFVGSCAPCGTGTVSIVRTTNGGKTFLRRTPFTSSRPGPIAFADAANGYLVTTTRAGRGVVWRTRDGGKTWGRVLGSTRIR